MNRPRPETGLVLADRGRDAEITAAILAEAGIAGSMVGGPSELAAALDDAGFAIIAEEALATADHTPLVARLARQPPWSDFPIILITHRDAGDKAAAAERYLRALGNVTLLERPFHPVTLVSLARAALRARQRQYQSRATMQELDENRLRLASAIQAAQLGVHEFDPCSGSIIWDQFIRNIWGVHEDEPITYDLFMGGVHPDDRASVQAAVDAAFDARTGGSYACQFRVLNARSGELVHVEADGTTTFVDEVPVRLVGTVRDVTEREQAQAHQQFLMRELAHRMKNQLAVIQAMVGQTARDAKSLREFQQQFSQRLQGLAIATSLLVARGWSGAFLEQLVEQQLKPFVPDPKRLRCEGPSVFLSPDATEAIGLALHELATNCVKHGSRSIATGSILATWNVVSGGPSEPALRFTWQERGGPPVARPSHQGFGTIVIERMVAQKVGGKAELLFAPDGLQWTLIIPAGHFRSGEASDRPDWIKRAAALQGAD